MIDLSKYKTVLTFFAHPDDETLAAGGTIKKLTDMGCHVHVAIPATGVYARKNQKHTATLEQEFAKLRIDTAKALHILGVGLGNIHLGEFPDNEMDTRSRLELIQWLEKIIEKVKPDLIITHHRYCTNIDHQYCHEAVIVATRPAEDQHIDVICGEVPSSTGYLKPTQWEPNLYVKVDPYWRIEAMETYSGEAREHPHPRSPETLKALATVRGSESGYHYAEAFMIQKMFA